MRIPEEVLKCVAFICTKEKNGDLFPRATGFFVEVPLETNKEFSARYFITAKHCVEGMEKDIKSGKEVYIRLNNSNGKTFNMKVEKNAKWFYHPGDSNVDVAIVAFPDFGNYDWKIVPLSMFLPEEHLKNGRIGIGDEVFITGLFSRHFGQEKNLPIVRVGNIAMIPDEKVHVAWHDGVEIDAYLIEARSIGGVSGSPVFFVKSPMDTQGNLTLGGFEFYLGGLIHGHWPVDESKIDNEMDLSKEKNVNMGIAIVVPAIKILEILNQEELKKMRVKIGEVYEQKTVPTKTDQ